MHRPIRPFPLPTDSESQRNASVDSGPWAPLRLPLFRLFWVASLLSNLGTWVHEIGAGWLMTELNGTPEMVSAVRTAMSLPIVLLAIPAGVMADRFDRRRILILTQLMMFTTTSALAALTFSGAINSWGLLAFTFVIGFGMVIHIPTWQASVPELVPRSQIPQAVALGSISFNLARSVGPAIGGVLIALFGTWIAFTVNALSFAVVVLALVMWKRETTESSRGLSFYASTLLGMRYASRNVRMRNVLIGVGLFIFPGSAFWSLLPLVVRSRLGWEADGYGILVTCVGVGALLGSTMMHRLRSRLGIDRTIAFTMIIFALGLATMSQTSTASVAIVASIVMGFGWMITLTTLNSTAQVTLPRRMRARGMGCYLTSMAISMALGSLAWGHLGGAIGVGAAQAVGAILVVVSAMISLRLKLESE